MKTAIVTKKVRLAALLKARKFVSAELGKLKAGKDQFRDIAMVCDINPPRITEAYTNSKMNESTLKKLLQGGIIDVGQMLKKVDFTDSEEKYIKSLLGNAREISEASVRAYESGFTIKEIAAAINSLADSKKVKKG